MKVKDIERTANVAWSPKTETDILLAAGTAAQQLDASFNTNAALELYSLNLTEPGPDMVLKATAPSEQRFHKIAWGPCGGENGTIIGGCDNGLIKIYSVSKLLKNENSLITSHSSHKGPVHALDFNPFQQNLFATGAGESEIFIWDMNNTKIPMSPGAKSQPLEDVLSVAWNRQVQHILASTFAPKCVIWDLRKNEPIIKLTDTVSRVRWKVVAWHPEVATQLCLASEEDHSPIIQLWDLRFATSPLKTLENHQRGVLSVAWCSDDPDLLVSCGKDNRILAWNPNSQQSTGEVLSEIAKTNQWSFDVQWCPKNPAIIACPGFDGHVSIYSLMGGKTQQIQTTDKIADSFPGMDGYVQAPLPQQNLATVSVDLSKPPKWMKRPVGASFGFGGKLITFESVKTQTPAPGQAPEPVHRIVNVSQVITEPTLVQKSAELEQALEYGNFVEYCKNKAELTQDQHKKYIWHFLKANFEENPRAELLNLLGYRIEDVNNRLNQFIGKKLNTITGKLSNLSTEDQNNYGAGDHVDPFDNISAKNAKNVKTFKIQTGDDTDGLITQALLLGNVEAAVELCLEAKRFADAIIIAMTGGSDLLARTQHAYLDQCDGYVSSLISALISEDWESIINNCDLSSWKEALAATLTHSSDELLPQLCEQLGNRLEVEGRGDNKIKQDSQLCYICSGSFEKLVNSWSGNAQNSVEDLQELVELVMFLQKSIERQGRQVQISGSLAGLLSHYASLLASQGNLNTALAYLGDSKDEKVASLRDRLHVSLGMKQTYPTSGMGRQQVASRRGSQRTSFSNYSNIPQPVNPQFNTGLPNSAITNPWQNPIQSPFNPVPAPIPHVSAPPRTFSPIPAVPPPVTQPPRPPSGSGSITGGLPQRKYVLDPSVTSNQYGIPPPSRNIYQPQTNPLNPVSQMNPITSTMPQSYVPSPQLNPVPLIPSVPAPIPSYGGGNVEPNLNERLPPPPPPTSAAPGWNDPPVLNRAARSSVKQEIAPPQPQTPITHPLYGSAPVQFSNNNGYGHEPPPPMQGYTQEPPQMFQPQMPATTMNNNYNNAPPQTYNPNNFNLTGISQTVGGGQQPPRPPSTGGVVEKATAVVEKPPIPEEHLHMKTVFDELKNQCSCAANNPQTKRKLEDVGRKLEALYDLLRENKLSPNTLGSLHQMVQLIQEGNYTGGLGLHTQLVSGPDFAQIASFMPGLKVLLQSALQLQVYIR